MKYGKSAGEVLCLHPKDSRDLFRCALVVGRVGLGACLVSLPDSFDGAVTNICANPMKQLLSLSSATFSRRQSSYLRNFESTTKNISTT